MSSRQQSIVGTVRRGILRRLPRPVRWLWFAILGVVAAECVGIALGVVLGGAWFWTAIQLSSILVGPVALGLLVVVGVAAYQNRGPDTTGGGQAATARGPTQSPSPEV